MPTELRKLRHEPYRILVELTRRLGGGNYGDQTGEQGQWIGLASRLGSHWLALPRHEVNEVMRPPRVTRVPGAKPWLLGVANVRGSLVPMIDLGTVLNGSPANASPVKRAVVFRGEQVATAFLVDEVAGFRRFSPGDQRHELQEDAPDELRPYLLGAFVGEGNPWLVFSLNRLAGSTQLMSAGR